MNNSDAQYWILMLTTINERQSTDIFYSLSTILISQIKIISISQTFSSFSAYEKDLLG